jgi:hypothetical protein
MHGRTRAGLLSVVVVFALCAWLLAGVASAELVTNGGFETGDFTGWHVQDQSMSAGTWFTYSGTSSPRSAHPIPAPPQGSQAAIYDQNESGSSVLYQDVTLPAGTTDKLSMYVYYTSYTALLSAATLDYHSVGNQQFRIDVISPSAPLTSLAPSDILATVFATQTGGPTSMAPTVMTADLSAFAGQTVRLRVAAVENSNYLNAGVDAVSIVASPSVATQPATAVSLTGATLNGTVNPAGDATNYHFEYGTTTAYGTSTAVQSAGSDAVAHAESATITGLQPGTTYHYRLVASNSTGTSAGPDVTVTTAPLPQISSAKESHRTWRASNKRASISKKKKAPVGTTFTFSMNAPGQVTFTFTQPGHGRKVKGKCVPLSKKNKHKRGCALVRGKLTFHAHAGTNKVRFYGRISSSKKLKPGRYTVTISTKTTGFPASSRKLHFTIVK